MGKEKKEKRKSESGEGEDKESHWAERLNHVTPIANPLASRKLAKKLYKCMKKGISYHTYVIVLVNIIFHCNDRSMRRPPTSRPCFSFSCSFRQKITPSSWGWQSPSGNPGSPTAMGEHRISRFIKTARGV